MTVEGHERILLDRRKAESDVAVRTNEDDAAKRKPGAAGVDARVGR
jgi:hypothetical protein